MDTVELYECLDGVWRPLDGMTEEDIKGNPKAKARSFFEELSEEIGKAFSEGIQQGFFNIDSSTKPDETGFQFIGRTIFLDDEEPPIHFTGS